ncbi:hypothetical protein ALO36_102597 [Pseudomonas syringae pv. tomato]|uniref:Uncharacterized protein n=2 Tax=Pseudomonas syringae group genomosp. 3 TaxID=251701 RepID=Q87ZE3_PSESM|nr:hypothetical protein PSPTO_3486 [Pseudomonas syringae pv. tomato str. DC3000]KPB94948.1 Uncharacterized protein AC502_0729 [Pseudomonas syringae pv. maculicola]KPW47136.1 Uncharacterized protein ALO86_05461 [Pseudomonas syringae pv. berberidis]KPY14654.1 Uncharacterized protein ALO54_05252 [Pseudomonas syringae pv. philadelphi]KPY86067.1 hypothetical protein ALO36_102597 [Pseudomonas syringae pv. tomato]
MQPTRRAYSKSSKTQVIDYRVAANNVTQFIYIENQYFR